MALAHCSQVQCICACHHMENRLVKYGAELVLSHLVGQARPIADNGHTAPSGAEHNAGQDPIGEAPLACCKQAPALESAGQKVSQLWASLHRVNAALAGHQNRRSYTGMHLHRLLCLQHLANKDCRSLPTCADSFKSCINRKRKGDSDPTTMVSQTGRPRDGRSHFEA